MEEPARPSTKCGAVGGSGAGSGGESAGWTGLAVVCLLTGGVLAPPAGTDASMLFLAAGALLLELTAAPLPGFGFFSPAAIYVYAALVHPRGGFAFAAVLLLAGLALRELLRSQAPAPVRLREALADALPLLLSGLGLELLRRVSGVFETLPARALGGLEIYLPAALWLPGRLALSEGRSRAWHALRARLIWPVLGVGGAGAAAAVLGRDHPAWALTLLPAALALRQSALAAVAAGRGDRLDAVEAELVGSTARLSAAEQERDRLRTELHGKTDQLVLIQELAASLHRAESLAAVLEVVVAMAFRLVSCRTVVVYLCEEGRLVPTAHRGARSEELASAPLLGVRDPLVESAWERGVSSQQTRDPGDLPAEPVAALLVMPEVGVLLVSAREPFDPNEMRLLSTLAAQAAVAIQSAQRRLEVARALEENAGARQRLERWVDRLSAMLEGFRQTAAGLEAEPLLDRLAELLGELIPHQSSVLMETGELALTRATCGARVDPELLQSLLEHRRPLLVEDIRELRFQPLAAGQLSLLAAPIIVRERAVGAIVLGAEPARAFQREHQDLLMLLAYQAGVALDNARQHRSLVEAYRRLQESEAQLIQSSKLAAVGQLAAGVAHELNNPLGAVLLALDSAAGMASTRPDKVESKLELAQSAVLRARNIVDKLLFYSREGRQSGQPVRLDQVVADTLALMGRQLEVDGVEVEVEAGAPPAVLGSHNELQQVVTNLLLNARDSVQALPEGQRRVRVQTGAEAGRAWVLVRDNGPGVPPELAARIFEPFFTTRPVGLGTGLGLSVSQKIVTDHGGTLELCQAGEGASFRATLPIAPSP